MMETLATNAKLGVVNKVELESILRKKIDVGLDFSFLDGKDRRKLLRFVSPEGKYVEWFDDSVNDVRNAAERLGLIPLAFEFFPSSESEVAADMAGTYWDDHFLDTWPRWFERITSGSYIVPDTNVLLKRTLTRIILRPYDLTQIRRLTHRTFQVAIPRLAILELENLANRVTGNDREKATKGECFIAFHEVRHLKRGGAVLTNPLTSEELKSFSQAASKGVVDAFLRDEVRRFSYAISRRGMPEGQRTIFLTRDLVSALAANSEDMNAFYVAPKSPEQRKLENVTCSSITDLIIETSIARGSGILHWSDGTELRVEGIWSGKNTIDYDYQRVKIYEA